MNIAIFGLGYVGCVSAGCLARAGHNIIGVDIAQHKVNLVKNGKPTIIEKDIFELIASGHKNKRITATTEYMEAVSSSEVSLICVGTPSAKNGHLNLEYIYRVAEQIGKSLKSKNEFYTIAIRSTVMPGTNRNVSKIISEKSKKIVNKDFAVVSNPEFLREGNAVYDFIHPPFTVLGTESDKAYYVMKEVYKRVDAPLERVNVMVAELIKYVNNSYHALKITFANEIGNICKKLGIDSQELMNLFIKDTHLNISPVYFKPGFAYGGSCLPKDLKGLKTLAHDLYLESPVLNAVEKSNEAHKKNVINLIISKGKRNIGFVGLSFKEGTDDLRNSPAVDIVEALVGKGYNIKIFDNNINLSKITGGNKAFINEHLPHLSKLLVDSPEELIKNCDVIVVTQKNRNFYELANDIDKIVIDLVRLNTSRSSENYEGIAW